MPFDYVVISWGTNYASNPGFSTCLLYGEIVHHVKLHV